MKFSDLSNTRIDLTGLDSAVILNRAADLIEKGWTQFAGARTEDGSPTGLLSETAVRFCLVGAVLRSTLDYLVDNDLIPSDGRAKANVNHPIVNNVLNYVLKEIERATPEVTIEGKIWLECQYHSTARFVPSYNIQTLAAAWNDHIATQHRVVSVLRRTAESSATRTYTFTNYPHLKQLRAVDIHASIEGPDTDLSSPYFLFKASPAQRKGAADLSSLFPKTDTRVSAERPPDQHHPKTVKEPEYA